MGWSGSRLQLWDWERWDEGVRWASTWCTTWSARPPGQPGLRAAEDALLAALPGAAAERGVAAAGARLTLVLYLLELAGRFVLPAEAARAATIRARAGPSTLQRAPAGVHRLTIE